MFVWWRRKVCVFSGRFFAQSGRGHFVWTTTQNTPVLNENELNRNDSCTSKWPSKQKDVEWRWCSWRHYRRLKFGLVKDKIRATVLQFLRVEDTNSSCFFSNMLSRICLALAIRHNQIFTTFVHLRGDIDYHFCYRYPPRWYPTGP